MKKILFLLATTVALFSSCSPKFYERSLSINLKSFCEDGFRITPFEYSSVGFEVIGTVSEEFYIGKPASDKDKDKVYSYYTILGTRGWDVKFSYMIEKTIASAKKMGADGLMNFEILAKYDKNNIPISYVVNGTAVDFEK